MERVWLVRRRGVEVMCEKEARRGSVGCMMPCAKATAPSRSDSAV